MTQSLRGASAGSVGEESRALHQQFATEIAVERTRLLYQGSQVPTLFMLLGEERQGPRPRCPETRITLT